MSQNAKESLQSANAAITSGDHEAFLQHCTEDTHWIFLGDVTLRGKDEVRAWMKENYKEPPKFKVNNMIADDRFVVAIGTITTKDADGNEIENDYCDVWEFRDGKMAGLRAFVIPKSQESK